MKIVFSGEFTDLNTYIRAERTNRYISADIKRNETYRVFLETARYKKILGPVNISIDWYSSNQRKDPDNISFAVKFILDGLVKRGIIESDGQKTVKTINNRYFLEAENPRVEVNIDICA